MARKLEPEKGLDDIEVLFPDINITIAGRPLTVREYRFVDGLHLRTRIVPFLEALAPIFDSRRVVELNHAMDVFADQWEQVVILVAHSAGVEPEWVQDLPDAEGELLMLTWWRVNAPFFVRRLQTAQLEKQLKARRGQADASASAGPTSSTP